MQSYIEIPKLDLPWDGPAEMASLGAVLIDRTGEAAEIVCSHLPDLFWDPRHRTIFESMVEILKAKQAIDLVTLTSKLKSKGKLEFVGGATYLYKLAHLVPTAKNVGQYISSLQDNYLLRQIMQYGVEFVTEASQYGGAQEILGRMQTRAAQLSDQVGAEQDFKSIRDVGMAVFEQFEQNFFLRCDGKITGLPSGYVDLDKMTSGFQRQDLIIVAARPSVGKTAFALNIAQNVALRSKETVAVFSLEMSAQQLVQRMVSAEGNLDAGKVKNSDFSTEDWTKVAMTISKLAEAGIMIDDSPGLTVQQIKNKCRRLKNRMGLGLVIIDYLQLLRSLYRGENRQQEVSEISRTLKEMARELNVPVIALSQLSRGVEQRQDKRPMMSDLRESGSIEQDADIVAFLYRDDYYNQESEKKNIIEIIIAKQRNGPVGTVELVFLKNFSKFANYERAQQEAPAT
ncbi:replicative DNA helicase [Paenibacillus macerans]|uniref:Replicative DNA helicase n=1 Tax=Paenibacillus macerans TaxID=44252 RepID=A0A090YLV3_PAEMA|nr:replicative DNA helicase [Paenibacillus macerans]KFM93100.1 replicative DNA helicase [Paenibacillus macerans]MCY7561576.1 replicative DNA helicase [Paenibacillus macerans]MEC0153325.1 replicative DNA helicase [Paenibacillus macerans]SUA84819.1 replicative DNA helicase [Paenibacillus macerans]